MRPAGDPVPAAFGYAAAPHERRHGPRGYLDDTHYKPWLRDEFTFRCVYCGCREVWFPDRSRNFSIEHLRPASDTPPGATSYDSLLYSCCQCNSLRGAVPLPTDPCGGMGQHLRVQDDGSVAGTTPQGVAFIRTCHLNRPELRDYRRLILDILAFLLTTPDERAAELLRRYLAYPDDLPDLSVRRPPGGNARPDGIAQSAFARRARGELPPTY